MRTFVVIVSFILVFNLSIGTSEKKQVMQGEFEAIIAKIPIDVDIKESIYNEHFSTFRFFSVSENIMPTWADSLNLHFMDASHLDKRTLRLATEILYQKMQSSDRRDKLLAAYLFTLKCDTLDLAFLNELRKDEQDDLYLWLLNWTVFNVRHNFFKNYYGLFQLSGMPVLKPVLYELERPTDSEIYVPIWISKDGTLCYNDYVFDIDSLTNITNRFMVAALDKFQSIAIIITADSKVQWHRLWLLFDPFQRLSSRRGKMVNFFFTARPHWDIKAEPDKIGLNLPPIEFGIHPNDGDLEVMIDSNQNLWINQNQKEYSELQKLDPGQRYLVTINPYNTLAEILDVLSLIKKSNPSRLRLTRI